MGPGSSLSKASAPGATTVPGAALLTVGRSVLIGRPPPVFLVPRSSVGPFVCLERSLQRVEPLGPVGPIVVEPGVHMGEGLGVQRADVTPTFDPSVDEPGLLQNLDVLGDGGQRDWQRIG